jgi:signal recognition particle subunit SRP54
MLENLTSKLTGAVDTLKGRGRLEKSVLEDTLKIIRESLIDSDVNIEVVNNFVNSIAEKFDTLEKSTNPAQQLLQLINNELEQALGGSIERKLHYAKHGPTIIMLVGLQGAGKTTFAAKLALHLKNEGNTPLLVAADLQRANAVEQLKILGEQADIPVYAPDEGNQSRLGKFLGRSLTPLGVAKDGVAFAKEKLHNFVIVDTAGRLGVDQEMIKEASQIKSAISPSETLFVIDSLVGQDAVNIAKSFNDGVGLTGAVLTKLDSDTKGGVALSVASVLGKPILFASTGEKLDDLEAFVPERMASRILDLGDLDTLIEKAEKVLDEEKAEKFAGKLKSGKGMDYNDMLEQFEQIEKMGDLKSMMKMIPGMGKMSKQLDQFDPKEITKTKALIQSMTPYERSNPDSLNVSRKLRIANGSGREVSEINGLKDRFEAMNKMMKGKGLPKGMQLPPGVNPADFGIEQTPDGVGNPGAIRKKKKKKYGNPKKQALYEKGLID